MGTQVLDAVGTLSTQGAIATVLVEKRDGRVVEFDPINIIGAVKSAFADLGKEVGPEEDQLIRDLANQVEGEIQGRYNGPAKIEDIQNLVEHGLIEDHLYDVARTYTTYRLNKDIERAKATDINEAVSRLVNRDESLVRENANKDSNVYATQRDLLAGAVSKASAFSMLPDAVSNAHMKGDIHFHDADYSPFTSMNNCSLPDFGDMLAHGFALGNAMMDSPKSIGTASTQITQIIKDIAGAQYGGQTVNRADEMLEPYARKDYDKNLKAAHAMIPDIMPVEAVRAMIAGLKAQEPDNLHFENREPLPADVPFDENADELEQLREVYAKIMTRKAIYDAMQTMEYQINSNRVSNGQTPFVTVGFGLGTTWFAREIQRAMLLNRIRGLGKDRHTAIFPKLVFTIKHGINADKGDPNYDMKQLALECSTKRMYPDVVFYENIVKITGSFKAPMGCRSFLQGWINPKTGEDEEDGRMNLGVVTVNVPRIALESHGDKDRFWKLFAERMEIAHQALQFRIMRCKQATPVNAPTLFRYGAFGRLGANDNVDQLFNNSRSTVSLGYIGLYEATSVFYGKDWMRDHGWDPQGKEFALSIVKRMTQLCKQWENEEGYHYSVYSTPAESLTDRFNRMDREKFGA
jgi:ribonucleoside-triphosphate reductase